MIPLQSILSKIDLELQVGPETKNAVFPLTRTTLFNCPNPTDFIGKLEPKGQYKTVIVLITQSGDWKSAGHWTILMKPYEKGKKLIIISTNVFMEYCGCLNFHGVLIFMVFVEGPTHEFQ